MAEPIDRVLYKQMKASIVIPVFNQPSLFQKTIQSLQQQSCQEYEFEVVVVDHGSDGRISRICSSFTDRLSLSYVRLEREEWSISRPKNAGILAATGEIIILLDSGIIVPSTFVEAHINKVAKDCCTVGFCFGASREDKDWLIGCELSNPDSCWNTLQARPNIADPRDKAVIENAEEPWVLFWGGNAAAPKKSLIEVGLFDETLTGWGFDDIELGYRLHKNGLNFRVADRGWGIHLPHPRAPLEKRLESGYKNFRISLQKHPTLEMELYWRSNALTYHRTLCDVEKLLNCKLLPDYQIQSNLSTLLQSYISNSGESTLLVGLDRNESRQSYLVDSVKPSIVLAAERSPTVEKNDRLPLLGIEMPFGDNAFATVVITDIWKSLGGTPCPTNERYLYYLLTEALRVGQRVVIFNDTDFTPNVDDKDLVDLSVLNELLNTANLQNKQIYNLEI